MTVCAVASDQVIKRCEYLTITSWKFNVVHVVAWSLRIRCIRCARLYTSEISGTTRVTARHTLLSFFLFFFLIFFFFFFHSFEAASLDTWNERKVCASSFHGLDYRDSGGKKP